VSALAPLDFGEELERHPDVLKHLLVAGGASPFVEE
jgi:hypothetical protein